MKQRKPKKSKSYFTKITDCAIIAYNQLEDRPAFREKVYRRFIYPALMKLSENVINTTSHGYIDSTYEDLQFDLVTFLTERLNKFKPESGKAYSYYTRTAYNYVIGENERAYKKLKKQSETDSIDLTRNVLIEEHNIEIAEIRNEFIDEYIQYCYDNLTFIFNNENDIKIADAIIHLFEHRDVLDVFNKKAIFTLIRERTNLETPNITRVIKVLKDIYSTKLYEFERDNYIKSPF